MYPVKDLLHAPLVDKIRTISLFIADGWIKSVRRNISFGAETTISAAKLNHNDKCYQLKEV